MTPGMIELGDQQSAENRRLAALSASIADIIIVVGHVNRESILAGLAEAQCPKEKIVTVPAREDAFAWLNAQGAKGDLVLIENDLGDLHEGAVRF
jgi:UDP-N-acetylmuramyl pentapeptide synthase